MTEPTLYLRAILSLVFVLGLIGLVAVALKRWGGQTLGTLRGRKRLGIIESLPVDARHRLLLIRRDDTEHLILIGASHALLVESPIAGAAVQNPSTQGPNFGESYP